MKIWCVDHAGLSWNIRSDLYFTKYEAEEKYNQYAAIAGFYVKMYQVEDIWGWCGRHFDVVLNEIIASRDTGDESLYIYNLCNEIKEAAAHCGVEHYDVYGYWADEATFVLSVAWFHDGKLHHEVENFDGLDDPYDLTTITERRSKWEKKN